MAFIAFGGAAAFAAFIAFIAMAENVLYKGPPPELPPNANEDGVIPGKNTTGAYEPKCLRMQNHESSKR